MFDLTGRVALITGGASGNGKGGAEGLAKQGATVVLADISENVFETVKEFEAKGYKAAGVVMDVTNAEQVNEKVKEVVEKYGKIDILFNNAGVMRLMGFCETDKKNRDFNFKVNIEGTWNVAHAVFPYMAEKQYGRIINTASVTGFRVADAGSAAYAMSKAAIIGLTKALAMEGAQIGISVNSLLPGIIRTNLYKDLAVAMGCEAGDIVDACTQVIPQRRAGTPDDIGAVVAFLASEEAGYVTGTEIILDGGETLYETTP